MLDTAMYELLFYIYIHIRLHLYTHTHIFTSLAYGYKVYNNINIP